MLFPEFSVCHERTRSEMRVQVPTLPLGSHSHSWTLGFLICKMTAVSTTSQTCGGDTSPSCCMRPLCPFREIVFNFNLVWKLRSSIKKLPLGFQLHKAEVISHFPLYHCYLAPCLVQAGSSFIPAAHDRVARGQQESPTAYIYPHEVCGRRQLGRKISEITCHESVAIKCKFNII